MIQHYSVLIFFQDYAQFHLYCELLLSTHQRVQGEVSNAMEYSGASLKVLIIFFNDIQEKSSSLGLKKITLNKNSTDFIPSLRRQFV